MGNKKGLVFHIIHGSFVDGYGIRTTVFLKGCPLRYLWCCNPEGQRGYPELKYTASDCNGCGNCLDVCPTGAVRLDTILEKVQVDRELCTNCGKRIDVCYTGALECFGSGLKAVERVDLLAYHTYGAIKYEQLGGKYTLSTQIDVRELTENTKRVFERYGLNVQLGG